MEWAPLPCRGAHSGRSLGVAALPTTDRFLAVARGTLEVYDLTSDEPVDLLGPYYAATADTVPGGPLSGWPSTPPGVTWQP